MTGGALGSAAYMAPEQHENPRNVDHRADIYSLGVVVFRALGGKVPFDPRKPFDPSGLRIGTPSLTSRGMGTKEMEQLAGWIERVVAKPTDEAEITKVAAEVKAVCARFPAPGLRT